MVQVFEDFEADEASVVQDDGEASQSPLGYATDAVTGALFDLLHFGDASGIEDSSKNLRVLWARALLDDAGELEDKVAHNLLPKLTRDVAKWDALTFLALLVTAVRPSMRMSAAAVMPSRDATAKVAVCVAALSSRPELANLLKKAAVFPSPLLISYVPFCSSCLPRRARR